VNHAGIQGTFKFFDRCGANAEEHILDFVSMFYRESKKYFIFHVACSFILLSPFSVKSIERLYILILQKSDLIAIWLVAFTYGMVFWETIQLKIHHMQ